MEKINSLLIVLLIFFTQSVCSQSLDTIQVKEKQKLKIVFQEAFVDGGVGYTYLKGNMPDLRMVTLPYLNFSLNNYLNEKVLFTYILTPVAMYASKNEFDSFRVRCFQSEIGISGSFSPYKNLWLSAGTGLAYRFAKSVKNKGDWETIGDWEQLTTFEHLHLFGSTSVMYWFKTNIGFQMSGNLGKDFFAIKGGIIISLNTLQSIFGITKCTKFL